MNSSKDVREKRLGERTSRAAGRKIYGDEKLASVKRNIKDAEVCWQFLTFEEKRMKQKQGSSWPGKRLRRGKNCVS